MTLAGRRRLAALVMLVSAGLGGCQQAEPPTAPPAGAAVAGAAGRHVVQRGETLAGIGARYGVAWRRLALANGLADPDRLLAGQSLVIPAGAGSSAPLPAGSDERAGPGVPAPARLRREPSPQPPVDAATPTAAPPGAIRATPLPPPSAASQPPAAASAVSERPPAGGLAVVRAPAPSVGTLAAPAGDDGDVGRSTGSAAVEPAGPVATTANGPAGSPRPEPPDSRPGRAPTPPDTQVATVAPAGRAVAEAGGAGRNEAAREGDATVPPPLSGDGFLRPVDGPILGGFGDQPDGRRNDGLNFEAAAGSPVRAAEGGVVAFLGGDIAGFGTVLLVRHADRFTTAYGHLDSADVAVGERVRRGQTIARVGQTGAVDRPQLHFELRQGRQPLDPTPHLAGAG